MSEYMRQRHTPPELKINPNPDTGELLTVEVLGSSLPAPKVPQELLDVAYDEAKMEDDLRGRGWRSDRIREKVGRRFGPVWTKLMLQGYDIGIANLRYATPPEPRAYPEERPRRRYADGQSAAANDPLEEE